MNLKKEVTRIQSTPNFSKNERFLPPDMHPFWDSPFCHITDVLFYRIKAFDLFCKSESLESFQPNHFVPLFRFFKKNIENQGKITISRFYSETNITSWWKLRFEQNTSYSVNTVKCPNIHPACFIHLKDEFCLTSVWQTNNGQKKLRLV